MTTSFQDLLNLSGKVAVVTGASKGIGAAIARGLAGLGAKVVVSSRKQDAVDAVAGEIRQAGGTALGVACPMGDVAAIERLVSTTVTAYGGVDVVVNNAATNPVYGPILEADAAVFQKILAVNVQGPLELAKLCYPHLKARGGGSLINVSSVGGLRPEPLLGLYSVSKAALISLTKVLAQEWGRDGIRANALCPGLIQTRFSAALWQNEDLLKRFLRGVPLGRIGQPEEMVGLALFLASPASSYCTGAVFTADGGATL